MTLSTRSGANTLYRPISIVRALRQYLSATRLAFTYQRLMGPGLILLNKISTFRRQHQKRRSLNYQWRKAGRRSQETTCSLLNPEKMGYTEGFQGLRPHIP